MAFSDPWLRTKQNYCVEDHHLNGVRNERVCSYFRPNAKEWDVHKVQQHFHEDDFRVILQTRIPQHAVRDRLAWTQSFNGQYSVKSAYHYWLSSSNLMINADNSKGWKRLWNLNLPHKIKIFLWRFCKNNIPVRYLLRSKGVLNPITCPMCEGDIEHLLHVFFDCTFAQQCWSTAGLNLDMRLVDSAPA